MKKSGKILSGIAAVSLVAGMCVMPVVIPEMSVTAYAEATNYTWVVEPTIQTDDINPAYAMALEVNYGYFVESKYHIIKENDKFGVIDLDGNIIIEQQYLRLRSEENDHFDFSNDFSESYLFCTKNGKMADAIGIPACSLCDGWLSTTVYGKYGCYDKEKDSFARIGNAMPSDGAYTQGSMMGQNSDGIITGDYLETAQLATFNNDKYKYITLYNKFGVVSNGNIIVDFDYDSALTYKDGVTALRKDGNWYYFDESGNQIIDIAVNGELPLEPLYDEDTQSFTYSIYVPYLPSDGYIAVNNENGGGYYDVNGKAWVKYDGKWGVIDIANNSTPVSTTTTTTTTTETTTTTTNTVATITATAINTSSVSTGSNNTTVTTNVPATITTTTASSTLIKTTATGKNVTTGTGSVTENNVSSTTTTDNNNNSNDSDDNNNNSGNNNSSSNNSSSGKSSPKTGVAGVGMAMTGIAVAIGTAFVFRKKNN